jgi:hypothetical protein
MHINHEKAQPHKKWGQKDEELGELMERADQLIQRVNKKGRHQEGSGWGSPA